MLRQITHPKRCFADIYQQRLSAGQVADKDGDDGPENTLGHSTEVTRPEALIGVPLGAPSTLG